MVNAHRNGASKKQQGHEQFIWSQLNMKHSYSLHTKTAQHFTYHSQHVFLFKMLKEWIAVGRMLWVPKPFQKEKETKNSNASKFLSVEQLELRNSKPLANRCKCKAKDKHTETFQEGLCFSGFCSQMLGWMTTCNPPSNHFLLEPDGALDFQCFHSFCSWDPNCWRSTGVGFGNPLSTKGGPRWAVKMQKQKS